jgi:GNAT superfamily N-acetyltransferase
MQAPVKRPAAQPIEYRRFRPEESDVLPRFFLQAGYMLPVTAQDAGWGAWSKGELVGALALSSIQGLWLLRGPEIVSGYRRRGVGAALLDLAIPEIRSLECYCACYSHLIHMYERVGFRAFPLGDAPPYFAQQIAIGRKTLSNLVLLKRLPG